MTTMMRKIFFLLSLCIAVGTIHAQKITRSYQRESLSRVLEDINAATGQYEISFVYNDLEDFTVTCHFERLSLEEALMRVVGFYPVRIVKDGAKIFVECTHKTERHLKGHLVDEGGQPLSYANVSLLNPADSTLIGGGVTNENGDFVIPTEAYRVVVKCSFVGYKTAWRNCEVGDLGTIQLLPAQYTIKGVTVEGTHIMNYVDKSVHTFSHEQIRQARHVHDLLEHVEDLRIDPLSKKIKRIDGGNVKILLNGISASDIDLIGIPANKIAKVEYYNIPPARYADAGTLINVITKKLDNGVNAGIDSRAAFTTGFTDDEAYLNLTSGNHQLSLSYWFSLREYTKRFGERTCDYLLNGEQTHYESLSRDKFGYRDHNPVIKYTYNKPDDIAVQITATPYFNTYHDHGTKDIEILSASTRTKGEGTFNGKRNTFGPSLNVYLQKTLPKNQELAIDLLGTYYHGKSKDEKEEIDLSDNSSLLSDKVNQKNKKYSFIGELAYTKKWEQGSLSLGYRGSFGRSKATISNVLSDYEDYDYASASYQHYMYAEYSGTWKKLMYRIGAGATQVTQDNDDAHDSHWLFTPKLILSTNLSKKMSLQWETTSWSSIPTISQLSNNASLFIPGVMHVGNPSLKSYNNYSSALYLRWNLSWLNATIGLGYNYSDSPTNRYYTEQEINGEKYIVGMMENANYSSDAGGFARLNINPFKNDLLTIYLQNDLVYQTVSSPIIGQYHHTYAPFYYSIRFRKGCWGASYSGKIVSKQLWGSTLDAGENLSDLTVFWQKKGWRIYATDIWFLTRSRYSSNSLPTSILQSTSKTWINDNKSMFVIGFSYDFSSGKNLKLNRKLQNKDTDTGAF